MFERRTLGEVVRAWRNERGITVSGLGRFEGLSKGYVSEVEHGKIARPNTDKLHAFANALDVTVSDLVNLRMPRDVEQHHHLPPSPWFECEEFLRNFTSVQKAQVYEMIVAYVQYLAENLPQG